MADPLEGRRVGQVVERAADVAREKSGALVPGGISVTWQRIRFAAALAYFGALGWLVVTTGVPTGTTTLAMIIVVGLAVASLGQGWRRMARVITDWLPFTVILLLYDRTRGVAQSLGLPVHEHDVLGAERWLFGGNVPTVWMQQTFYDPFHVHIYDALATLVYTSHFLATPVLAAVLWLRNRRLWLRYISRVVVLALSGLVTYVLFPEAPPWMAARDGLIDPVSRLSARGWIYLHAENLNGVLARAQDDGSNPVAAMPSLHIGFAALVALFLASLMRTRWRYLLALYPVSMGITLVYTGEHYVLDLLVGVLYALLVHAALCRWEARRSVRAAA